MHPLIQAAPTEAKDGQTPAELLQGRVRMQAALVQSLAECADSFVATEHCEALSEQIVEEAARLERRQSELPPESDASERASQRPTTP